MFPCGGQKFSPLFFKGTLIGLSFLFWCWGFDFDESTVFLFFRGGGGEPFCLGSHPPWGMFLLHRLGVHPPNPCHFPIPNTLVALFFVSQPPTWGAPLPPSSFFVFFHFYWWVFFYFFFLHFCDVNKKEGVYWSSIIQLFHFFFFTFV